MPNEAPSPVADSSTAHDVVKQDPPRTPGGSIELLYCEKCGCLILGGSKNAQPSPNGEGFYCKKCIAVAPKTEAAPVVAPQTVSRETKELPRRRNSSTSLPPATRDSGQANNRSKVLEPQSRSKRQAGPAGKQDGPNTMVIYGAVAAGVVLLFLGVSMLGGAKSDPAVHTASAGKHEPAREPTRVPERKEPERSAPPVARVEPAPVPVQKAEPLPTPPVQTEESAKTIAPPAQTDEKAAKAQELQRDPAMMEERSAPKSAPSESDPAKLQNEAAKEGISSAKKSDAAEEDLNKPGTPARAPSNPFSVTEGGEDPTKVLPGQKTPPQPVQTAAAKPKPSYEKGRQSTLFPADRDSQTVDHQSPAMAQGQKSGIPESKYDGWSWMGGKLDGFNVKGGLLSLNTQGVLTLDGYPSKQFELSFEVQLSGNSALAIHSGSSKNGINLIMFIPNGVMTGVWDQSKTKDNIKGNNKEGKPLNMAGGFVAVKVQVAQNNVEVFSGGKSVFKGPLPNPIEFGQFGLMCLGVSGNTSPSLKMKNVVLFTP